jgi:hypothetical protein
MYSQQHFIDIKFLSGNVALLQPQPADIHFPVPIWPIGCGISLPVFEAMTGRSPVTFSGDNGSLGLVLTVNRKA